MSSKNVLKKSAMAAAVAGTMAMAITPLTATAEVSGSLDIANQYLWRGQTLISGGTISGSLDYEHESGLYAGIWTSSEGRPKDDKWPVEYDLYAGFAGDAGEISYDVGVVQYRYSAGGDVDYSDLNFQEAYLGLGMGNFSLDVFVGLGEYGDDSDNKDNYLALGYGQDKFSASVGYYSFDDSDSNYAHLDLSYEVYENFTFTASSIVWEDTEDSYEKEPTFVVAYSFPF